jgi:PST family polysaccharide transporter
VKVLDPRSNASLEKKAARGLGYAIVTFLFERGFSLAVMLVLARVLVPSEFGVVAFALVVINYLDALTDLGLGAALIYRTDGHEDDVSSTAFWLGMVNACVLGAAMFAFAPAVAGFGGVPSAEPLLRVLALQFPISALGNVHEYRLRAELQFRELFAPSLTGAFAKGSVTIIAAAAGAGIWSLVIGQLTGELVRTVALWRAKEWRPRWRIKRSAVPGLLRFGLGIVAVGLLGNGAKNFDYLVVGATLGEAALGFYFVAFRLPELVVLSVFHIGNDVLFPYYARLNDRDSGAVDGEAARRALRTGYLDSVRVAAAVAFPAAFGMAALATPIVLTLYGAQWRPSAAPLTFVALWTGLAAMASMPGAVFKALGRSWLLVATGVMQLVILLPAIWFAAPHGIAAVAAVQVLEKSISLGLLGVVVGRVLSIRWYATYLAAAPAAGLSALMALVVILAASVLSPAPALVVGTVAGVACYGVLLRAFMPDVYRKLTAPFFAVARWRARLTPETAAS